MGTRPRPRGDTLWTGGVLDHRRGQDRHLGVPTGCQGRRIRWSGPHLQSVLILIPLSYPLRGKEGWRHQRPTHPLVAKATAGGARGTPAGPGPSRRGVVPEGSGPPRGGRGRCDGREGRGWGASLVWFVEAEAASRIRRTTFTWNSGKGASSPPLGQRWRRRRPTRRRSSNDPSEDKGSVTTKVNGCACGGVPNTGASAGAGPGPLPVRGPGRGPVLAPDPGWGPPPPGGGGPYPGAPPGASPHNYAR